MKPSEVVVNHRKNVVKAYYIEQARLKELKAYRPYDEGDSDWHDRHLLQSETRLKLLKELREPLKDYYDL